ncbi:transposase [Salinibacter ruber]|uniref:transposase n=1 Tax=Salinibacter ruber TaxID=146919 RepID=UPI002451BA63|nr:hypothetical protein [Salinibacter ruber]
MIPPEQNANFVAKMEDVLSVYKRPHDPKRPVACMDEMPRQLIREVRTPLPMESGPKRHDYRYKREGVVNLFMFFEPLTGWRTVMTRERRTKIAWAHCMRQLLEKHYPDAEKVILVMDNLNTHGLSLLRGVSSGGGLPASPAARNPLHALGAAVGRTWRRSKTARWPASAFPGGFQRNSSWKKKRRLGQSSATKRERRETGGFEPEMHASNCGDFTQTLTTDSALGTV